MYSAAGHRVLVRCCPRQAPAAAELALDGRRRCYCLRATACFGAAHARAARHRCCFLLCPGCAPLLLPAHGCLLGACFGAAPACVARHRCCFLLCCTPPPLLPPMLITTAAASYDAARHRRRFLRCCAPPARKRERREKGEGGIAAGMHRREVAAQGRRSRADWGRPALDWEVDFV